MGSIPHSKLNTQSGHSTTNMSVQSKLKGMWGGVSLKTECYIQRHCHYVIDELVWPHQSLFIQLCIVLKLNCIGLNKMVPLMQVTCKSCFSSLFGSHPPD